MIPIFQASRDSNPTKAKPMTTDTELLEAFKHPESNAECDSARQQIIARIVTDFDAVRTVFSVFVDEEYKGIIDRQQVMRLYQSAATAHDFAAKPRFPATCETPDAIKALLPSGEWTIWTLTCGYEKLWGATENGTKLDGEGMYKVTKVEQYSVPTCADARLVQAFNTVMLDLIPLASKHPIEKSFGDAYLVAIYRKRVAHAEILTRISAGVTTPFAGLADPEIEQAIRDIELAKSINTAAVMAPTQRERKRIPIELI